MRALHLATKVPHVFTFSDEIAAAVHQKSLKIGGPFEYEHGIHAFVFLAARSISVIAVIAAISPPAIRRFVSFAETAAVSVSIAVLKRFNWPHPGLIPVSGFFQSSHIDVPRVIFPSFVLTFAIPIAIAVLNAVCVGLPRTAIVVIVVMVPVSVS